MKKVFVLLSVITVFIASCNTKDLDPLPDDTSAPSLTYPIASFSTVTKFIPFGGTLPSSSQNKGYDIFMSDTNQNIAAACRGIVTAVNADAAGNSAITVKYKSNSIYSFIYSGVKDVIVDVTDSIEAGTILGKLGSNKELYFAVVKSNEVICPRSLSAGASSGFNNAIDLAIAKHNAVNTADSVFDACLFESLPK